MQIIEKPDPAEQLQFLEKAVSVWKWAIFPLQPIKRNYKGSLVWCACSKGLKCPTVGKHPKIHWTDRTQYPDLAGIRALLAAGMTGWGVHLGWSQLAVLDVDPRNGGRESLVGVDITESDVDGMIVTGTGGGGIHAFMPTPKINFQIDPLKGFVSPDGQTTTSARIAPGIELLAGQHFAVCPFSPHRSGKIYRLIDFPK